MDDAPHNNKFLFTMYVCVWDGRNTQYCLDQFHFIHLYVLLDYCSMCLYSFREHNRRKFQNRHSQKIEEKKEFKCRKLHLLGTNNSIFWMHFNEMCLFPCVCLCRLTTVVVVFIVLFLSLLYCCAYNSLWWLCSLQTMKTCEKLFSTTFENLEGRTYSKTIYNRFVFVVFWMEMISLCGWRNDVIFSTWRNQVSA